MSFIQSEHTPFQRGDRVCVLSGEYEGKFGYIVFGISEGIGTYIVHLDSGNDVICDSDRLQRIIHERKRDYNDSVFKVPIVPPKTSRRRTLL